MPQSIPQPSFAAGELSPSLWARTDLAKYKIGMKRLQNWFVRPHGGISNRPGLQFVQPCPTDGYVPELIPFEAASNDTYMLEFGHLQLRIYRNGAIVRYPTGHAQAGQIVVITTPYNYLDVRSLNYEQANDVVTLTHPLYQPRDLTRFDHHDWRFSLLTFAPAVGAPASITVSAVVGYSGTDYFGQAYAYKVTAVNDDGEESLPTSQAAVTNDLAYKPNYNVISWPAVAGATRYNVFKGRNGVYGYIGYTPNLSFTDNNIAANMGDTPQVGNNPFSGVSKWPRCVTYHQQRKVFASTTEKPSGVWMTQSGSFKNMGVSSPLKDSDAVIFAVAARSLQKILHMVSVEDLILFTPSTEHKVSGPQDDVITPSSLMTKPQSYFGAADLRPLVVGSQILFVQSQGQIVRDLTYKTGENRYTGDDLTILASHLFAGRTIVDWTYAKSPHSLIWCVMSDGNLLCLTYIREHEVWAWTRHVTDGYVERVSSVPENGEDAVYLVVRRFVNGAYRRYIERMHTRTVYDVRDAFFVDSGLSLDNPLRFTQITLANPAVLTLAGHGMSNGDEVEAYSTNFGPFGQTLPVGSYVVRNATTNTFTLEDVDSGIAFSADGWTSDGMGNSSGDAGLTLPDDTLVPVKSLPNTTTGAVATKPGAKPVSKPPSSDGMVLAGGAAYALRGVVRKKYQTLGGLDHLEGRRVVALADGNVVGMDDEVLRVVSGSVTLPYKAARVHVGLPYEADAETLPVETTAETTAQGILRSIPSVQVKFEFSRGLSAGPDFDSLVEFREREFEDYDLPVTPYTGDREVAIEPKWDALGTVALRQRYPLPATVLSFIPKLEFGG